LHRLILRALPMCPAVAGVTMRADPLETLMQVSAGKRFTKGSRQGPPIGSADMIRSDQHGTMAGRSPTAFNGGQSCGNKLESLYRASRPGRLRARLHGPHLLVVAVSSQSAEYKAGGKHEPFLDVEVATQTRAVRLGKRFGQFNWEPEGTVLRSLAAPPARVVLSCRWRAT